MTVKIAKVSLPLSSMTHSIDLPAAADLLCVAMQNDADNMLLFYQYTVNLNILTGLQVLTNRDIEIRLTDNSGVADLANGVYIGSIVEQHPQEPVTYHVFEV